MNRTSAVRSLRLLFLVDGLGAFVTFIFLFVLLPIYQEWIGMPHEVLRLLSLIALTFSVYSFACFFFVKKNSKKFLQAISIGNMLYCLLTAGLILYHYERLTILGLSYFILEIVIIAVLVFIELKTLKREVHQH